jgi:putative ABC transport system permease protein
MSTLLKDVCFAARGLRREPAVAFVAILSLGVGIVATTTIFSVVYTVLLAPPVYRDAGKLVVLWEMNHAKGINRSPVAPATFRDWRQAARSFERLELVAPGSPVTVTGPSYPERANIQYATAGLFSLLGVDPLMGRIFQGDANDSNTILITHPFWQRHFGNSVDVIGAKIVVNGTVRTVIGVLPERFSLFDSSTDLWMPISAPDERTQDRNFRSWLVAVGRMNRDTTLRSAQAEMDVLGRGIADAHPASNKDWGVRVDSIQEAQFGSWKSVLSLVSGAVLALLLIACANVSNLFLGRLLRRRRELSIRASLGATRFQLVRQLLVEGLVIAGCGCVLGLLLTGWGISLFVAVAPPYFPLLNSVAIHTPVLLFALTISLLSGLALAFVPALLASRVSSNLALRSGALLSAGRGHARYRNLFAIAQISLCMVLLLTAGLMIRSAAVLTQVDRGFQTDHVITMQMFLAGPRYVQTHADGVHIASEVDRFYDSLLDGIKATPGVDAAAIVSWLPQMGYNTGRRERNLRVDGRSDMSSVAFNAVSTEYFKTLRIPLLAGREFSRQDDQNAPWSAIANQAFAQRFWPEQNPIGRQLFIEDDRVRIVVGVVGDVRQVSPEVSTAPEVFVPFTQQSRVASGHGYQNRVHMSLVVRSANDPRSTVGTIRAVAARLDGTQPVFGVRSMSEVVSDAMSFRRLYTILLALAAAVALFLAAIGVYSVISQSVHERTAELGLRIAVGASAADIYRLIVSQALKLTAAGIGCGLAAAEGLRRVVSTYLFGINGRDPFTIAGVTMLLSVIAAASIMGPAIRAIRTDPVRTLRHE